MSENSENKLWVLYAILTAILFTLCNEAISEISQNRGPECLFYFASGSIFTGLLFFLYKSVHNFKKRAGKRDRKCWHNQNIIINGKLNCRNLLGYSIFCMLYFVIQNCAIMTMWFASRAGVNVGVITCIWSINPLFMSLLDFLIFGRELRYYHIIGTIALVLSALSISLVGHFDAVFYMSVKPNEYNQNYYSDRTDIANTTLV